MSFIKFALQKQALEGVMRAAGVTPNADNVESEKDIDEHFLNEIKDYAKEYNCLAKTILNKYIDENHVSNQLLSPLSIIMLLAIAADATLGVTKDEITKVMTNDLEFEKARVLLSEIQAVLSSTTALSIANAVCVSHKIEDKILPEYKECLQNIFDGKMFASKNIMGDVNKWVNEKTHGLIEKLIDKESNDETAASLINAVAFKADWADEFKEEDIIDKEFENADGTKKMIPMLHGKGNVYIETDYCTGFIKFYKGSNFSFMALLPKDKGNDSIRSTIEQLDFSAVFYKRSFVTVNIVMPEFEYECTKNLTHIFKELGIKTVFSNDADFSKMTTKRLKAGSIIHKARIELDRKGTKAVAVTYMGLPVVSAAIMLPPKQVVLDRPFIYAIMHNKTGLPVFTGVLNKK